MAEQRPEWMKLGARAAANDIWALIERHEREEHDGQPCMGNRFGMVAYVAHVIGVRSDWASMELVTQALLEYEHDHEVLATGEHRH